MKPSHNKGKGQQRSPPSNKAERKSYDGDAHFGYNLTMLIGCTANVLTLAKERFEGIFVAFSSSQELMLEAAHRVIEQENNTTAITEHFDVLIIAAEKILAVMFQNVNVNYATREFLTDSTISSGRGYGGRGDKELTPWDADDSEHSLEEDLSLNSNSHQNGWEARDMFKKNEVQYGVVSSFNKDLSGYTSKIDKSDPDTLRKHEEQAIQVAKEIEKNTTSWERIKLEDVEDEEEAFSAVVRPRNHSNNSTTTTSTSSTSGGNEKYTIPSRRNNMVHQGNASTSVGHPPSSNSSATSGTGTTTTNGPGHGSGPSFNTNNNNSGPRRVVYPHAPLNTRNSFGGNMNPYYSRSRNNNFDSRRGPQQVNNNHSTSNNVHGHGDSGKPQDEFKDVRGSRMSGQQNLGANKPERRGREDMGKAKDLLEFHQSFNLQTSKPQHGNQGQNSQGLTNKSQPSPSTNHPQTQTHGPHGPNPGNTQRGPGGSSRVSSNMNQSSGPSDLHVQLPSQSKHQQQQGSHQQTASRAQVDDVPPLRQPTSPQIDNSSESSSLCEASCSRDSSITQGPEPSSSASSISKHSGSESNVSSSNRSPQLSSSIESPRSNNDDDSKNTGPGSSYKPSAFKGPSDSTRSNSSDSGKFTFNPNAKEFTFNPNAKEFNPTSGSGGGKSFAGPSSQNLTTPPRPPSSPSNPAPAVQIPQGPPPVHTYVSVPMNIPQTVMFAPPPYPQPVPSSGSPSGSNSGPRHGNPRNKGPLLGVPQQRPDLGPQMQLPTSGAPLMATNTLQPAGGPHAPYTFAIPPAPFSQVRLHPSTMMSLYSQEGNAGTPMHMPMQYIHPQGGGPAPNSGVHQSTGLQPNNQGGHQSVGHAYGQPTGNPNAQHLVGYPFAVSPYGHHMIQVPYPMSHQGGSSSVLSQSQ